MHKIVAHRGASHDAPENTMESFRLAWAQDADAVEGDFRLTRDGQIVCIHDADTKRVSGQRLVVAESTVDELRTIDVGAHHKHWAQSCRIPTLSEVLATVPSGKSVYLEIKCGTEIVPALLADLSASGMSAEQIVIISFNAEVLRDIKSQAPQYKAFWLVAFRQDGSGEVMPSMQTVLSTLEQTAADGVSAGKDGVTEAIATSVREHGYEFHVWTVDRPEDAARFLKWGAKSITTNVPGKMRAELFVDE